MPPDRDDAPTLDHPVFIVGSPRSGTTLVQCIVSASPETFSLPETHFFSMVLPSLRVGPFDRLGDEQVLQARAVLEREAGLGLGDSGWNDAQQRDSTQQLRALDLFLALIELHRPVEDKAHRLRLVEKTPLHVQCLDEIGMTFPTASFVHVVRNPVDVVSSWIRAPFASSKSVLSYAEAWGRAVTAARAYEQRFPDRMHTLAYETLVARPERTVADMCAFLKLPFEDRLLREFGKEAAKNVSREETWKDDVQKGVLLKREGIWRDRMTPGQGWLVEKLTAAPRASYGYRAAIHAYPWSILAALLQEARARFIEARRSSSLGGALRHAGSPLKALRPTGKLGV